MIDHLCMLVPLALMLLIPWRRVRTVRWGHAEINFDPEAGSAHSATACARSGDDDRCRLSMIKGRALASAPPRR